MKRQPRPKGEFSVRCRCTVTKIVTVVAESEDEARRMVEAGEWKAEQEVDLIDCDILGVSKD
jgi:hypothetical protein